MARTTTKETSAEVQLEGQTTAEAEGMPVPLAEGQIICFSKGDIADMMGVTTQAMANRAAREEGFPPPTYTNESGSVVLYTEEDVRKIYEFMTRADRERLSRLDKAMAKKGLKVK